jgi:hypothetical protein
LIFHNYKYANGIKFWQTKDLPSLYEAKVGKLTIDVNQTKLNNEILSAEYVV